MRRIIASLLVASTFGFQPPTTVMAQQLTAPTSDSPQLRKLNVPAEHASAIATKLSFQFRETPGVQISSDARNKQLIVMAPEAMQQNIAREVQSMLASDFAASATKDGRSPMTASLKQITWREFEDDLQRLSDAPLSVTTSRNGELRRFPVSRHADERHHRGSRSSQQ